MVAKKGWFSLVESPGFGWRGDAEDGSYTPPEAQGIITYTGTDGDPAPSPLIELTGNFYIQGNRLAQNGAVPGGTIGSKIGAHFDRAGTNLYATLSSVINAEGSSGDEAGLLVRYVDQDNFIDLVLSGGTFFLVVIENNAISATIGSYAVPGYSATQSYVITSVDDGAQIKIYVDDILAIDVAEARHAAGTYYGYKSAGGFVRFDDLVLPNARAPVIDHSHLYVYGHSMFDHDFSSATAPADDSTSTGYWLGWMASNSGTDMAAGLSFGQLDTLLSDWDTRGGPPTDENLNGNYPTNTFNVWPSGNWEDQDFNQLMFMASNFQQRNDFDLPDYIERFSDMIDRVRNVIDDDPDHAPSKDYLIYIPSGVTFDMADPINPTAAEQANYHNFHAVGGQYWNWFEQLYEGIRSSFPVTVGIHNQQRDAQPSITLRMCPVGIILSELLVNETYMQTVNWQEIFADGAPHGTRNMYFIYALVTYRVLFMRNPNLINAVIPASFPIIPEIADNIPSIIAYIEQRLAYYETQGMNIYGLVKRPIPGA